MRNTEKARFVRAAIEKDVPLRAASLSYPVGAGRFDASMELQDQSTTSWHYDVFRRLDCDFHKILCAIGNAECAFEVLLENNAKMDR